MHPEFFEDEMLSLSTIALVLTIVSHYIFSLLIVLANGFRVQIENNLDEWVTGEHISVAFSQTAYEQKYIAHLKRLKDFDERTKESGIVPRIRKHLLKMGRYVITKLKRSLFLI